MQSTNLCIKSKPSSIKCRADREADGKGSRGEERIERNWRISKNVTLVAFGH